MCVCEIIHRPPTHTARYQRAPDSRNVRGSQKMRQACTTAVAITSPAHTDDVCTRYTSCRTGPACCVCVCMRMCVRACARLCMCACVYTSCKCIIHTYASCRAAGAPARFPLALAPSVRTCIEQEEEPLVRAPIEGVFEQHTRFVNSLFLCWCKVRGWR